MGRPRHSIPPQSAALTGRPRCAVPFVLRCPHQGLYEIFRTTLIFSTFTTPGVRNSRREIPALSPRSKLANVPREEQRVNRAADGVGSGLPTRGTELHSREPEQRASR